MLSFLNTYAGNVHSQNGEDLIIAEVLKRLRIEKGVCCEIGGNDGAWMSNTRYLLEQGWAGVFVETDFGLWQQCRDRWVQRPDVKCICSHVDGNNINAFVDDSCDLLSLDTDGSDYELFKGLKARPKIVIVEIDSSIEPPSEAFNSDGGASYMAMLTLALGRGYFLLAHTGNLVLVRDEYTNLFSEVWGTNPLKDWHLYFNRGWIKEAA